MLLKGPDLPWTCLMFLKVRRVSLPSPPNTLEILENYYFSPRRHPENGENVEHKKKKTLLQWIDLIERSPKMPSAVALLNGPTRRTRSLFSYVAKRRAGPGEDLMLLKAKSFGDLDFANYPPLST